MPCIKPDYNKKENTKQLNALERDALVWDVVEKPAMLIGRRDVVNGNHRCTAED